MQVEYVSDNGSSSGDNPVDLLSEGSSDEIVESSDSEGQSRPVSKRKAAPNSSQK